MKHQKYHIKDVVSITGGELVMGDNPIPFERIAYDSRNITNPEKSVFFAFTSKRQDGHIFISDLYNKGLKNFIVNKKFNCTSFPKASFIKVADTVMALHQLAAYHRNQFTIPIVGITGSNGKTIIKEWLYQLLESDYNIVRNPKSFNSQIGVPFSVWQINEEHDFGFFEAGISQPGEMENLKKVIEPKIGIFTNIGHAHDEGFLNIRQKINEKLTLFSNAEIIIYCKDHFEINESIVSARTLRKNAETKGESELDVFSWSKSSDADLQITHIDNKESPANIKGQYKGKAITINIPFIDEASIENAIHCWALMLYLGYDNEDITNRMAKLTKVAMRLELKKGINNCSLINDSYNSDLESLKIALDFVKHQKQHKKKTVVLSDILQSGMAEKDLYDDVASLIKNNKIHRLIGIGASISRQNIRFIENKDLKANFYLNTDEFINDISSNSFRDETILLKGARKFKFEKISNLLEERIHETILDINLNALEHNLNVYRSMLKPKTKVIVMVKAFSYGSGSFEIANLMKFQRVDYLAVAYVDEGVELRKSGINMPIIVMNPERRSFEAMISYNLEPEIYSLGHLQLFERTLAEHNADTASLPYPIHIKLDTGMKRLGFTSEHINELLSILKVSPSLKVKSVFSHLVASHDKSHDKFTNKQISQFQKMAKEMQSTLKEIPANHILNSAGIVRFPEAQFDMVRLGIGLYGIDTTNKIQHKLKNVSTLKTTVSQIKKVAKGDTIGYNRSFKAKDEMMIAIVSLGYADGLNRKLGNGAGSMYVKGHRAPIVGDICMDMTMIDISNIGQAKEGDEVIVFGDNYPIQKIASNLSTIPYEIMTGISKRVKRVYFQE